MILQQEHWHLGYAQILKDCRPDADDASGGTVWILCNADVDAMSAARILCYMLRSDGVPYQLRPCTSYSALHKTLRGETEDVGAVVLLNLGANRNLTRLFDDDETSEAEEEEDMSSLLLSLRTKVYVMDCRRPFHLANVHAGENVVLFWDQAQLDEIPSDGDNLSGNESTSSSSSSSSGDDDSSSEGEAEFEDHDDEGEEEFQDDHHDNVDASTGETVVPKDLGSVEEETDRDYDGEDERDEEEGASSSRRRARKSHDASSKRRKTRHDHDGDDDDDDSSHTSKEDAEQQGEDRTSAAAEDTTTQPTLTPRELHQQRRDRLRLYYSGGSYYGSPAAYVAYRLSMQLRFGNVGDLLWLACVGVTDAYLHARIDVAGYTTLAMDLRRNCHRLYPNDMYHRVGNTVYAEHLTGTNNNNNESRELTQIGLSENGRILAEKDYRFFMLRYTSLFDSMVYSNYVSTRLQLWTNRGMQKLQELLAKMGYPLEECRQPYAFMKPSLKRRLRENMAMHAEEYGIENFDFTSFIRITGYKSLLSASDMSYAVTALLECETPATASSKARVVSPNGEDGEGRSESDNAFQVEEELVDMQNFNTAFDALNSNGHSSVILSGGRLGAEGTDLSTLVNGGNVSGNTGIGAGIKLAMSLQRSIIGTAVGLVERNAITRLRHFRYAYITCTSDGSHGSRGTTTRSPGSTDEEKAHVFAKPLALTKLAHYLMDMHRENGKWAGTRARPLVLMAEKPHTRTYLVVGYEYPDRQGNFVRNRFGEKFELAAKTMKGTFKFDSFDSNVVEVDGNDVQRFIEQLHYMMDSV